MEKYVLPKKAVTSVPFQSGKVNFILNPTILSRKKNNFIKVVST
jgi:hypothetical protein